MTRFFASFSFGCRVNTAETEEITKKLIYSGYIYDGERPDFYLINSCAVTQKAERETKQFIYQIQKKFPRTKIILTGCAATKWNINKKKIPSVYIIINNREKKDILNIINSLFENNKKYLIKRAIGDKFLSSGRYFLKIQDGCQRFCSYCIVPLLRGKPRSKKIEEVIKEIKSIEEEYKEVILTAVNTEAFGIENNESFPMLINDCLFKTKIERISLGSVNPWSVNNDFINFYKKISINNRFIKFLHIPLQSGSDKILNLMERDYSSNDFVEKIKTLENYFPLTFFGTDIIVGFPGETEEDFSKTYNLLNESPISKFHVFRFSEREGTKAFLLSKKNKIDSTVKIKRAKIISNLSKQKLQKFLVKHIGVKTEGLFLEKKYKEYYIALINNQVPVFIQSHDNNTGKILPVFIERMNNGNLFGKII